MSSRFVRPLGVTVTLVLIAVGCSSETSAGSSGTTSGTGNAPSFDLKLGDIMSLTGDLGTYGPPIENGAQAAIQVINDALAEAGVTGVTVEIVATEDDQTDAKAGVEAATKLVQTDGVDAVIGPLASTVTLAVAQSVTIPNKVVTISPSSSASNLSLVKDDGYLYRTAPADAAQAHFLVDLMGEKFGSDATVNVGVRNDDYGTGFEADFSSAWEDAGGTIGQTVEWNPDAPTFDSEAQDLVSGSPDAWLIVDFPETFAKVGPALVRTGSWDPTKTFVTDGLRDATLPKSAGDQATEGLLGTSPTTASNPAAKGFDAVFASTAPSGVKRGTYDVNAFDAVIVAFLAALEAGTADSTVWKDDLADVSGPGGTQYAYRDLAQAIQDVIAGTDIDYEGTSGPINFDENGDPSGLYDEWAFEGGQIKVIKAEVPAQ
jgi:ABC-type branched-subunit amino acid transport system substrate-binding protein